MPRPRLLSYCATFLPREMLHVYRQISAISGFEHTVVTRRRRNAEQFPFEPLVSLRKSPLRILRRAAYRLRNLAVPVSSTEVNQLLKLVEERQVDVFHAYLGTEAARLLKFLRRAPCAKVVSFHGTDLSDSLIQSDLEALIDTCQLFLVRSESLAEALRDRGCPADRIRLTRTGIPLPETVRPPRGVADKGFRLLQACRLIEKKGLDVTLDALALLLNEHPDYRLDIAGDGPLLDSLQAQAAALGIADRISWLGFIDNADLLARMPGYDAFLHPSRITAVGDREGIPNSMLEAMACGVPVVATRHSGIPEAIEHEVNGLLIESAEPAQLAAQVAGLRSDVDRYNRLSTAAAQRVRDAFSIDSNRDALEACYREAIELSKT